MRMQSVLGYVRSSKFFVDICVGALSAIPRWRFARVLDAKTKHAFSPRLGNALGAFYSATCDISQGKNALTEHIVNRDPCDGELRMTLFGSIMRSYLYVDEKCELSYNVDGW